MKLNETRLGCEVCVVKVEEEEKLLRRLEALGILEGTRIRVLNRKRNGATIIKVRGSRWALGNDIAAGIEVEEQGNEK